MAKRRRTFVGVDLGGTKILTAVVSADGTPSGSNKLRTEAESGAEAVTERIVASVGATLESAGVSGDDVAAVGVGSPGPLDPDNGVILTTPNLGWNEFPLRQRLEDALGWPVYVDNDVKVGTFGEVRFGAGKGCHSVVGIFVGTGVGGGIVLKGRIHHGASRNAAEIGHHVILAGGPRCGCGVRGCLEALTSRTAIVRELRRGHERGMKSSLGKYLKKGKKIGSGELREAYDQGDRLTRRVMHDAAEYLGIGIANMLNVISPQRVVLGGGVMEAFGDVLLDRISDAVRRNCFKVASAATEIVLAKLGDDAGVVGAAEMARVRHEAERPGR